MSHILHPGQDAGGVLRHNLLKPMSTFLNGLPSPALHGAQRRQNGRKEPLSDFRREPHRLAPARICVARRHDCTKRKAPHRQQT
ncbi:hypothetical protein NSPZN2_10507 [Nitrospira defluvii]|uniref:Uncharacterized protein n=1 Tax=Nitrospira defluvii TaxID=330214 RepID=A0ABM8QH54_9BACT|nr:hypothetical protein NSPZN2_10507 [Nitrospira defluvii]